jgi:hypothetical protein
MLKVSVLSGIRRSRETVHPELAMWIATALELLFGEQFAE